MKRTLRCLLSCFLTAGLILLIQHQAQSQCAPTQSSGALTIAASQGGVNAYYPGVAGTYGAGSNSVTVNCAAATGVAHTLAVGDLVMVMQMQGTEYDNSNTDAYGDGVAGGGSGYKTTGDFFAGRYEYLVISAVAGCGAAEAITFSTNLLYTYATLDFDQTAPQTLYRFQMIWVPRYTSLTINAGVTVDVLDWNGTTGGVFAADVFDAGAPVGTFTLEGTIDANGAGFRGGGFQILGGAVGPVNTDYVTTQGSFLGQENCNGAKGEGISGTPRWTWNGATVDDNDAISGEGYIDGSMGRGAPGNAGGGATDGDPALNDQNSGGGGGGNGGIGGFGGRSFGSDLASTQGIGAARFAEGAANRVVLGGGGGAASGDDAPTGHGGKGGGIVIITAEGFASTTGIIQANGTDGTSATTGLPSGAGSNGGGGGGAGGSIVLFVSTGCTGTTATLAANGGNGGNAYGDPDMHGPGGGGGGGVVFTNCPSTVQVTGGSRGYSGDLTATDANAKGATSGADGAGASSWSLFVNFVSPTTCLLLPVKLNDFKLNYYDKKIQLSWTGVDERNVREYVVERSVNGTNFIAVGSIAAKNMALASYNFTDPLAGVTSSFVYYRLKAVDFDGVYRYSSVLSARLSKPNKRFLIYPNPANVQPQLYLTLDKDEPVRVQLINSNGQVLSNKSVMGNKGANVITIDETQRLAEGVYILKVVISKDIFTEKLVIKR